MDATSKLMVTTFEEPIHMVQTARCAACGSDDVVKMDEEMVMIEVITPDKREVYSA